ncbi:MAG: hypothetical protein KI790_20935 [Cyclobacteriaceae bacterium]|nr:hypothetical protein [Cyclobacteriaceae bacterium HetDA_MAG_MS6]
MSFLKYVLPVFLTGYCVVAHSQSTRDVEAPKPPQAQYQAMKKEKKANVFAKVFRKKEKTEVQQFRERVSENLRKRYKEERQADKPQYNNPTYFGHKKPPKKRPLNKRKMCKECGIKH